MRMKWKKLSPIDLYIIKEILDKSKTFIRSNNIGNTQDFSEQLLMEELPVPAEFYSFMESGKNIGFIKLLRDFPLPGFINIRLLVIKESHQLKGHGANIIKELKRTNKTLWVDHTISGSNIKFFKKLGFKEEAGRLSF